MQQFIKNLREYGIQNDVPNITETNAKFLRDLIKIKKPKNILEIGTANGLSAIEMGEEAKKIGANITTIEFSPHSSAQARNNFEKVGLSDTINLIEGNALDVIPTLDEVYQFVFIDGMKRRTKDFLELVWDKVEEEGIIIIDDVIKFEEKMVGLKDYLQNNNISYNTIPIDVDDGVVMIVKSSK